MEPAHPREISIQDLTRPIYYNFRLTGFFRVNGKYCRSHSARFDRIVAIKYLLPATSTPDVTFLMYLENNMKLVFLILGCFHFPYFLF